MIVTIRKTSAADDRTHFYGRNAVGLGGVTPAVWGVFAGTTQIATIRKHGTFWEVFGPAPEFRRLAHKCFGSRAAACAWSLENLGGA